MEQKFSNNNLDLQTLREFCEREGEAVTYRKGDQLEREGNPARWLAFVTEGCFKYVTHGFSDDKEHITWFSFEGEFVVDYPTFLYDRPSQTTIEAMMPSRVFRVTGQQLEQFFEQDKETMKLRAIIAEHILFQFRSRYLDLHCATVRERYDLLMQRCPGIVEYLDLQDIASFLNVTPQMLSRIRKDLLYHDSKKTSFGAEK
jgi:CRP-like cAMP-binding protein